jgi:thymidine kinase
VIRLLPERGGWLEVVCGPMFSGKSEELIRRLRRAEIAGQRALIVKPRIDDRYDICHVVSHAGAKMRAVAVSRPEEIGGLADGYDAVGIDEVQFFAPQIVDVIEFLVERGTRVVAAGLDQDFRGLPFGAMPELLCRAELVDKLQAVCHRSTRTRRAAAPATSSGQPHGQRLPSDVDRAAETLDHAHGDGRAEIAELLTEDDRRRRLRHRCDVDLLPAYDDLDLVEAAVPQRRLHERGYASVDRLEVGLDRRSLARHVDAVGTEPFGRAFGERERVRLP